MSYLRKRPCIQLISKTTASQNRKGHWSFIGGHFVFVECKSVNLRGNKSGRRPSLMNRRLISDVQRTMETECCAVNESVIWSTTRRNKALWHVRYATRMRYTININLTICDSPEVANTHRPWTRGRHLAPHSVSCFIVDKRFGSVCSW